MKLSIALHYENEGAPPASSGKDYTIDINCAEVIPTVVQVPPPALIYGGVVGEGKFNIHVSTELAMGFALNIRGTASNRNIVYIEHEIPVGVITSDRGALLLTLHPVAPDYSIQVDTTIVDISISGVPRWPVEDD